MAYAITMKNGSSEQRKELYELESVSYSEISDKLIDGAEQGLEAIINTTQNLSERLLRLLFELGTSNYEHFENNLSYPKKRRKKKRRL